MTHFDFLQTFFLPDWTLLQEGWRGFARHVRLVSTEELQEYAQEQVGGADDDQFLYVSNLAFSNEDDTQWLMAQLTELASPDASHILLARRKWRWVLLHQMLATVGSDPADDRIKFTEFWASFDDPEDRPSVVPGKGDTLSPQTTQPLQDVINAHQKWLKDEYDTLKILS